MEIRKRIRPILPYFLIVCILFSLPGELWLNIANAEEIAPEDTPVYNENFEDYAAGATPDQWVFISDELNIAVVETTDKEGMPTKALEMKKTAGNLPVSPSAVRTIPATAGIVTVTVKARADQTNIVGGFQVNDSQGVLLAQIDFRNNGQIALNNGASPVNLGAYQQGQWYELKLVMDTRANQFDIFIDGELRRAEASFRNPADHVGQISMNIFRNNQGVFTYDDLSISGRTVDVTGVSLNRSSLTMLQGISEKLVMAIEPGNATNPAVTWESSDTNVAAVDDNGVVTGLLPGTATITVRTEEGSFTATCEVTVVEKIAVTGIKLTNDTASIQVGSSSALTAIVEPDNASIKDVIWTSSDPDVAAVDDQGVVTGIVAGKATITVTAVDGGFSYTCEVTVTPKPVQAVLYVSPYGADSNSGASADSPFRTIAKARDTVRTLNANMTGEIVVYLMGGTYPLEETLTFDERDSGSNGFHVIYKAYADEKPILSGGKAVTGWTLHDGDKNIYKADVGDLLFRQLYVNGERVTRARSTGGLPGATNDDTGHTTTMTEIADWKNIGDIEFVYNQSWTLPRNLVDSIEVKEGKAHIKMQQPAWEFNRYKGSTATRNPAWLENAYELLNEPGEWYLDRSEQTLYYIPREKDDLANAQVVVPVLEKLMTVQGSSLDDLIHFMRFEGLTFAYAGYVQPSQGVDEGGIGGYPDIQANLLRLCTSEMDLAICPQVVNPGHVLVNKADQIVFERNTFTKLGQAGLDIMAGSLNIDVVGNKFYDISGSGIQVGEVDWADGSIKFDGGPNHTNQPYNTEHYNPEDKRKIIRNVSITNNVITRVGVEYFSAVGIYAGFPENLLVAHNEISNTNYSGVSVGWGWGRQEPSVARDNKIMYNYVHDTMLTLNDGGGIYTLGIQQDSIIKGNYVKNPGNRAFGGIYLDECSRYFTVSDNVIQNNGQGKSSVLLNKCGFYSAVQDNYWDMNPWYNLSSDYTQSNNIMVTNGQWPQAALDIIAYAGIQPRYQDLLAPEPEPDTAALEAALNEARVLLEEAEEGEGPGQYPRDAIAALDLELRKAQTILDIEHVSQEQINAAIAALKEAIRAFKAEVVPVQTPIWPEGSRVKATYVGENRVDLSWTPASHVSGVKQYKVLWSDSNHVIVPGDVTHTSIAGLRSGTAYTFKIEAADADGSWSTDGPSAKITTKSSVCYTCGGEWPGGNTPEDGDQGEDPGNGNSDGDNSVDTEEPAPQPIAFTDVPNGHWGAAAIKEAVELGIVNGYTDGTFRPDGRVTRAEFTVMLCRAMKLDGKDGGASFIDQIPAWARDCVSQAAEAGIINGYEDGTFRPAVRIKRAEMTVMMLRALGIEADSGIELPFTDAGQIPAWARPSIAAAFEAGLVQGKGNGLFKPLDSASRAEAVTIILAMLNYR